LAGLEELVLLAVASLDAEAYGVTVQERLKSEARTDISLGAVYAALDRLERDGLVRATWGEVTPRRGGRRKRLFAITGPGLHALRYMERIRTRLWNIDPAPEHG
jgi:DNA-binding PadR family transcriptional regulator